MKSAFVLQQIIVAVAYPCAFAAEFAGLIPASVVSLPILAGVYVGAGVIALAFDDYRRGESRPDYSRSRSAKPEVSVKPATTEAMPAWACNTVSA